jgi:TRAP-type mannitol/chloroaromatic compound transport system permease small subunit
VALMLYLAFPYFFNSYRSGEVSSNAGGLLIWPAKGLILLGFISLGFQWLSELIKRVAIMNGQLVDEHDTAGHNAVEAEAERLIAELADTSTTKGGEPPGDVLR